MPTDRAGRRRAHDGCTTPSGAWRASEQLGMASSTGTTGDAFELTTGERANPPIRDPPRPKRGSTMPTSRWMAGSMRDGRVGATRVAAAASPSACCSPVSSEFPTWTEVPCRETQIVTSNVRLPLPQRRRRVRSTLATWNVGHGIRTLHRLGLIPAGRSPPPPLHRKEDHRPRSQIEDRDRFPLWQFSPKVKLPHYRVTFATASRAPPRTPWKPPWYSTSSTWQRRRGVGCSSPAHRRACRHLVRRSDGSQPTHGDTWLRLRLPSAAAGSRRIDAY